MFGTHSTTTATSSSSTSASITHTAKITLSPPCPIRKVLALHIRANADTLLLPVGDDTSADTSDTDAQIEQTVSQLFDTLMHWRELLAEYFGVCMSEQDGTLISLPQLVSGYIPDLSLTPQLLYVLAARVDWTAEEPCLFSVALALADFYTYTNTQHTTEDIVHLLLPALRTQLKPPRKFLTTGAIEVITSMEQLYKVFERC